MAEQTPGVFVQTLFMAEQTPGVFVQTLFVVALTAFRLLRKVKHFLSGRWYAWVYVKCLFASGAWFAFFRRQRERGARVLLPNRKIHYDVI